MRTALLCIIPAIVLTATAASGQHEVFSVRPEASEVTFLLGASDHGTKGSFHVTQGLTDFDPKAHTISGKIIVAAGSGVTGNASRDRKMLNEVLEATNFSDVTFEPKSYQGTLAPTGDSTIQVTGIFTLHGTPHELTTPMQIHLAGSDCVVTTDFTVPYVKWGLKDPSIFILKVAKEVQLHVKLAGDVNAR